MGAPACQCISRELQTNVRGRTGPSARTRSLLLRGPVSNDSPGATRSPTASAGPWIRNVLAPEGNRGFYGKRLILGLRRKPQGEPGTACCPRARKRSREMGTGQKDRRAPRKATSGPVGGIKHQDSRLSLLPRARLSLPVSVQKGWRDKGPSAWQTAWYQLIPAGIIGGRCTSCERFSGGAR